MLWDWLQTLSVALAALGAAPQAPASETLSYSIEWRLIHAGNGRLTWSEADAGAGGGFAASLHLESAGLVSRLYKVNIDYVSRASAGMCIVDSLLKSSEGSRRWESRATFDAAKRKAKLVDRDLVRKIDVLHEIDIRDCEHDVIGALYRLRQMRLEPGATTEIPVSDGKVAVMARVEAQERETIKTDYGSYKTIRYEAFLFNNVLYRRRGRLFVWLTDDERRLPVQIRVRMPFYIGTVTLQLKEGKA